MSIYNVRLFDYGSSQQIRIYSNPVYTEDEKRGKKDEKKNKKRKDNEDDLQVSDDSISDLSVNDENEKNCNRSFKVSTSRTKQKIYELARSNKWDWFITLTFDRKKIDSSDYDLLVKTVGSWFNHVKSRKSPDLKYLIIPELHKDGLHYHFHGLLADADGLQFVDSGIVQGGKIVYNMPDFKLGFTTATKVDDTHRVASYICKYITKQLELRIKGKRRYLASKNCNKPVVRDYNMTPDEKSDLLDCISERITHMKQQDLPECGQRIKYIELGVGEYER